MVFYAYVRLISGHDLVLKDSWCQGLESAQLKKTGIRRQQIKKVFFSPDGSDKADFSLPLAHIFNATKKSVYNAHIMQIFGK